MAKFGKKSVVVHRRAGVSKEKFDAVKAHAMRAAQKARDVASERMEQLVTIATPGVFGAVQARVPVPTVAGIEPTILYGVGLGAVGMALRGKAGKAFLAGGVGLLGAGAYLVGAGLKQVYGNTTVGEDDDTGE